MKELKEYFIGFFILMVAFSFSVSTVLQYALGFGEQDSMLKLFSSLILAIAMIWGFYKIKVLIKGYIPIALFTFFCFLYFTTSLFYDGENKFWSYFLSMIVRMGPSIIVGVLIANDSRYINYMKKAMIPFMLLYTYVVYSVETISVELAIYHFSYGGFNYQILSYYATFAYGMNMYLLSSYKFKKNWKVMLTSALIVLLIFQLYLILVPGGRGALVLTLFFTFYFGLKKISFSKLFVIVLALTLVYLLFNHLASTNALSGGLQRLSNFFGSKSAIENDDRMALYKSGIDCWIESPIFGHGIGSIWYIFGIYTHNIFTDLLCEGGVILFGIYIYILIKFAKRLRALITYDSQYEIYFLIFSCGFVMFLFSGYYSSDSASWFSITAVLMCKKNMAIKKQ